MSFDRIGITTQLCIFSTLRRNNLSDTFCKLFQHHERIFEVRLNRKFAEGINEDDMLIREMCIKLCSEFGLDHDFGNVATEEWLHAFYVRHPFVFVGKTFKNHDDTNLNNQANIPNF